jgi:hypothetical protein
VAAVPRGRLRRYARQFPVVRTKLSAEEYWAPVTCGERSGRAWTAGSGRATGPPAA